jgi:hypothetical protein
MVAIAADTSSSPFANVEGPNPTRRAHVVVGQLCGARVESYKA